ncbi:hypothetical protein VP01_309g6 [Puccinia sorghi]|uniref:Uncharacterized protein n=1 Tax=Puccinia sorghi TaxID=27349 RepID=A0A0L6V0B2_9BASI|nr:hypothetical protein VP01_309g6 [Puccinia sorghi]
MSQRDIFNKPNTSQFPPQHLHTNAKTLLDMDKQAKLEGYSAADCATLVFAVKEVLPLGSQERTKVQDLYN